jgi:hypothetical protein
MDWFSEPLNQYDTDSKKLKKQLLMDNNNKTPFSLEKIYK